MSTILEIARATGSTKPTVVKRLKDLGLWDGHVNKSNGGAYVVDDYAASAVADALGGHVQAVSAAAPDAPDVSGLYEARIGELKERIASLERQLEAKDAQISDLMGQLSEAQAATRELVRPRHWWSRLLGSGERP